MNQRVLVIGGGITGLTIAYRLQQFAHKAGLDPEILLADEEPHLGGKIRTEWVDGMVIEGGPDSFVTFKPGMKELCRELGLDVVGTNPAISKTYIYSKGRLQAMPAGMRMMAPTRLMPFLSTALISPAGKLRALMEPFIPIRREEADESIGSFVSRRFGRELLERMAGPLMAGIYGGDWDRLSLKATFPQFIQMERQQGSLLLSMYRSGRRSPPSGSMFWTVPQGLATVVSRLAEATASVRQLTESRLRSLVPISGGNGWAADLEGVGTLNADAVVLAIPAYGLSPLLKPLLPEASRELDAIRFSSSVVVSLAYRRSEVDHPLDGSGFLVPKSESLGLTACTWVSSKWLHAAPSDRVLLRCFLGGAGKSDWNDQSEERLIEVARNGLQQAMGIQAEPILTRIFRWPAALPQYTLGHLQRVGRIEQALERAPGLFLAGASYHGSGLPDCVRGGTAAAEQVARHLGWPMH